jgi:hypothetical protein
VGGGPPGAISRLAVGWSLLVLFHCSARVSFGPTLV